MRKLLNSPLTWFLFWIVIFSVLAIGILLATANASPSTHFKTIREGENIYPIHRIHNLIDQMHCLVVLPDPKAQSGTTAIWCYR